MTSSPEHLDPAQLHWSFGSGGSKAILGGTGTILLLHVLDMKTWKSIGAASGGFVPGALLASGKPPSEFLAHVVETDFEALLTPRSGVLGRLFALLRKYHYEWTRPVMGVYATHLLVDYINDAIPAWPDNFWTVAACSHGQVLFTKQGVYKYSADRKGTLAGNGRLLAEAPPTLGVAGAATCAIPGIMDAVHFGGEYLVDGALAGDGDTPIAVVTRHFGDSHRRVLAVDVGDENLKKSWWLRLLFALGCGGRCRSAIEGRRAEDHEALAVIRPQLKDFHSLQFSLPKDLKWKAVVAGVTATLAKLQALNLVPADKQDEAVRFAADLQRIVDEVHGKGNLSCAIEAYLGERGLYVPTSCS